MIALVALRAICSYERSAHFKFHLNGRFAHRNAFLCLFRKKIKKLHPQRDEDCLVLPPYFTLSSLKTPQCERVTRMLTGANRQNLLQSSAQELRGHVQLLIRTGSHLLPALFDFIETYSSHHRFSKILLRCIITRHVQSNKSGTCEITLQSWEGIRNFKEN